MIGSCVKMQTTTWDEEIKLLDGVLYEINFEQDFSSICLGGQPITEMPVGSIIEAIEVLNRYESERKTDNVGTRISTAEEYQNSKRFWEWFDEYEKEERKREEKWKEEKPNRERRIKRFLKKLKNGRWP